MPTEASPQFTYAAVVADDRGGSTFVDRAGFFGQTTVLVRLDP